MSTIPRAILFDQLEERIRHRKLLAGLFLTYQFDPAFLEDHVLPVFFELSASTDSQLKRLQLDDALQTVPHGVAVYYDQNGLVPGAGSSRLDIKRIAVSPRSGFVFHPKNIFALVEESNTGKDGNAAQALIVATLSANLTKSGWWQNVEVCHVEEIDEHGVTSLGKDLLDYLGALERRTMGKSGDDHAALKAIRRFLRQTTERKQRSTGGHLHTHFYAGRTNVVDFIESIASRSLRGMNLEIISPYFDGTFLSLPLHQLIDRFEPRETRIYLPKNESGEVTCTRSVFDGIRRMEKKNVYWARLPTDLLRSGKVEGTLSRFVHAKVYRFFRQKPRREILFTGSVNLTSAAHRKMGNDETAFLHESRLDQRPDWLLVPEPTRPARFSPETETEDTGPENGTSLSLRFSWESGIGEAYWDSSDPSPVLVAKGLGTTLFHLAPLEPREWIRLASTAESELRRVLQSTSILTVEEQGKPPAFLLVQEEGMRHRPYLILDLTPAEILRYWSLLTLAQRAEFLKVRAPLLAQSEEGTELLVQIDRLAQEETFFDTFAELFHSFGSLEHSIREALPDNHRLAGSRLFGQKYDALPVLLGKITAAASEGLDNATEHYLHFLCARQLMNELKRDQADFFQMHRSEIRGLDDQIDQGLLDMRSRLSATRPREMEEFLAWFERWFLPRAKPVSREDA